MDFGEWQRRMQDEAREVLEIMEKGPRDARELRIFQREKLKDLVEALDNLKEILARNLERR